MDTVRAILRAVASERRLSTPDSENWIEEREVWIGRRLGGTEACARHH